MAIAADPFAAPKAIGQGLVPITTPDYGATSGSGTTSAGAQSAAAGPFGLGGELSQQADQTRAGLSSLLQAAGGGANPSLDTVTGSIPVSDLGMPQLGGSAVSTMGTAGTSAPRTSTGGLSALLGPTFGESGSGGPSPVGGPVPASEGGRAFGPGSPFSGLSGTGLNLALSLASTFGGLGIPFGLGAPMALARGAETLSNFAFNPATNDAQAAFQNFFGTTPTENSLNQATGINQFAGTNAALAAQRSGERGDISGPRGFEDLSDPSGQGAPAGPGSAGPGAGTASGDSSTGGDPGGSTYGRGGFVQEPGTVESGEFVLQPSAVRRLGLARLMRENRGN